MKKYYKIFRIDTPFVELYNERTDMYDTYFTTEKCLVLDGGSYTSEEDAERALSDYFENFPDRAKNEEYVILKCYKMEE